MAEIAGAPRRRPKLGWWRPWLARGDGLMWIERTPLWGHRIVIIGELEPSVLERFPNRLDGWRHDSHLFRLGQALRDEAFYFAPFAWSASPNG